jgi:hypothetical protein
MYSMSIHPVSCCFKPLRHLDHHGVWLVESMPAEFIKFP